MDVSVVVPTLNGRAKLTNCLDSLATHAPGAEVVVVNGPSADGTTGAVRDRDDVDTLVEVSDRNTNAARNAGIRAASGDVLAFVGYDVGVEAGWIDAVRVGLSEGADAVTGPTHRTLRVGMTTDTRDTQTIGGTEITHLNGGNAAITRDAIEALDGFDEGVARGGARDLSHRLATTDRAVEWHPEMCVRGEYETDGGGNDRDWAETYESLAYRLVKTHGLRLRAARRVVRRALSDAGHAALDVVRGDATPTGWFGNGRAVVRGIATGGASGVLARRRDPTEVRNPNGLSSRQDRAVERYEF